jgi:CubicO group peptidase (beta-lactamase class C family)
MRNLLLSVALGAVSFSSMAVAQTAQQRAVESGLIPAAVFDGKAESWTIEQRMARWKVPGVSVAVIDDGKIVWSRAYGVIDSDGKAPVTTATRFQAASISKPVAATAALALVQQGTLALDTDINTTLKSWKLPASAFTADQPVTLRALLSHTGGTTIHGFPGYAQGVPLATNIQVLNGTAPANTKAVVSEAKPGERWKYSGGGYQIVQQMIEDSTGRPFADVVRDRVLVPAGMTMSGYALPPAGSFAHGHRADGKPVVGGWHTYPEQAAAALWTTPTDLARFGLALAAAYRGEPGALLNPAIATAMATPVKNDFGLGPSVRGEGAAIAFSHGGANEGFRAFWVIHPRTGDGVAVMTNNDTGDKVMMEIVRAVAKTYGWSDFKPTQYKAVALAPDVLATREGKWVTEMDGDSIVVTVRRDGSGLVLESPLGTMTFTPTSPVEMVSPESGVNATFDTGADGKPVLKMYGLELRRAE